MWPFQSKSAPPPPDDVISGDLRAHFDSSLDCWTFELQGVEFTFSEKTFDPLAFDWAQKALTEMQRLQPEIDARVLEHLDGWHFNKDSRELLSVSLEDYLDDGTLDLSYAGDESWGDYGINVVISGGQIVDVHGGD